MNLSISDPNMHSSSANYLEEDKGEILHSSFRKNLYDGSLNMYSNGSIISQLLRKTIQSKRALEEGVFFLPATAVSSCTMGDSAQEDRSSSSSKDSTLEPLSPGSHTSTTASPEGDRPLNEHHQAKRARVENIIRGMAGSPNAKTPGEGDRSETGGDIRETYRENKRKQRLPQHQNHSLSGGASRPNSKDEECHKLKEQLQAMQRHLRQLQEKFFQVYNVSELEHEDRVETYPAGFVLHGGEDRNADLLENLDCELLADLDSDAEKKFDAIKVRQKETLQTENSLPTLHKESKNLSEALKSELSRAVNKSVDSVLKKFTSTLLSQTSQINFEQTSVQDNTGPENKTIIVAAQEYSHTDDSMKPRSADYYESVEVQIPEDQTEALSLVVRKPTLSHPTSVNQVLKRPFHLHQPLQFNYNTALHENQILEHLLKYGPHSSFGTLPCMTPAMDRSSPDSVDMPWDVIKVRSKVGPSHMTHQSRSPNLGQIPVDSLCLPHVKMECGDLHNMADRNSYMSLNIQEGLTPNHLKKAKLMFFYTRYPSSNVLKTFFPDVKFNRCITSQLIKWFSNFREFYYIQMEKFARQAILDGVTNVKDLSVTRDSELFRALNMHYNKANDFQVCRISHPFMCFHLECIIVQEEVFCQYGARYFILPKLCFCQKLDFLKTKMLITQIYNQMRTAPLQGFILSTIV
nr:PREDICTED: prospero homeobox protein 2 isoform X2 [Lepisosteus oculatus]